MVDSLYVLLHREILQKEAEGLKLEEEEKGAKWLQEKQQLHLERDNLTQLIKDLQNQVTLSQKDTERVSL